MLARILDTGLIEVKKKSTTCARKQTNKETESWKQKQSIEIRWFENMFKYSRSPKENKIRKSTVNYFPIQRGGKIYCFLFRPGKK